MMQRRTWIDSYTRGRDLELYTGNSGKPKVIFDKSLISP